MDTEIKEIFGTRLIDEILDHDPCVVIKIPDVFKNLDWDIEKVIPHVYVNSSVRIKNGNQPNSENGLISYHYSGKHDFISYYVPNFVSVRHFHITVKYSEDYVLVNNNNLNELGFSLFDIIPQLENCWDDISHDVLNVSKPSNNPGWMYIPKFRAFEIWREKCGEKGPYIIDDPDCIALNCYRDCEEDGGKLVLSKLKPSEQAFINWFSIYEETFSMGFLYTDPSESIISPLYCVIPAWRKSETGCNNITEINLKSVNYSFNGQLFSSPEVIINEDGGTCKLAHTLEINFLAANKFPKDLNLLESIVIFNVNDASKLINISPFREFKVLGSDLYSDFQRNFIYCANRDTLINYLSHEVHYKF